MFTDTLALVVLSFFFFSCVSFWIISTDRCSGSLIFSSIVSNLLLVPSAVFFIFNAETHLLSFNLVFV